VLAEVMLRAQHGGEGYEDSMTIASFANQSRLKGPAV
jgi:hypothetical protein